LGAAKARYPSRILRRTHVWEMGLITIGCIPGLVQRASRRALRARRSPCAGISFQECCGSPGRTDSRGRNEQWFVCIPGLVQRASRRALRARRSPCATRAALAMRWHFISGMFAGPQGELIFGLVPARFASAGGMARLSTTANRPLRETFSLFTGLRGVVQERTGKTSFSHCSCFST